MSGRSKKPGRKYILLFSMRIYSAVRKRRAKVMTLQDNRTQLGVS